MYVCVYVCVCALVSREDFRKTGRSKEGGEPFFCNCPCGRIEEATDRDQIVLLLFYFLLPIRKKGQQQQGQ